jgi:hypothetical protein
MASAEAARLRRQRDAIVGELKSPWAAPAPTHQEFGRYERFERASEPSVRIVPKISRVQLGETMDCSTRPPRRVAPVSNGVLATHVDSFTLARPTESLEELVEWGADADEFYYFLRLGVQSVQARRKGDRAGAHALDLITGVAVQAPPLRPNKAHRVRALVASDPSAPVGLRGALYQSDGQRRARLDAETVAAFDGLAVGIARLKAERAEVERHRLQIGASKKAAARLEYTGGAAALEAGAVRR